MHLSQRHAQPVGEFNSRPGLFELLPHSSGVLRHLRHAGFDVLTEAHARLGLDAVEDAVVKQLELDRLIKPTSKADPVRVVDELGVEHLAHDVPHVEAGRAGGYRDQGRRRVLRARRYPW